MSKMENKIIHTSSSRKYAHLLFLKAIKDILISIDAIEWKIKYIMSYLHKILAKIGGF